MLAFTFAINISPFCLNFQSRLKIPHFFYFPFKTEAMLCIDIEWVEALHKGRGQKSVILNKLLILGKIFFLYKQGH